MSNLTEEFRKLWKKERPSDELLVPLMTWCSGDHNNIEEVQKINKRFFRVNRKILIGELTFNNVTARFLKYPKISKSNEDFFYKDAAKYFGWTTRELKNNLEFLDLAELKEFIASSFAYENKERKILSLSKLKRGES